MEHLDLPDGAFYKGQVKKSAKGDYLKHGQGTQIWKDGAKYEGEWKDGKANGKGVFYHVNGDIYEG